MQFSIITIFVSIASLASALPAIVPRQDVQAIANAQNAWAHDTSVVSQFLGAATSLTGADLTNAAQIALDAEKDELTHKAVLDAKFGTDSRIISANTILVTEGTFQLVVNNLANLAQNGATMSVGEVQGIIENTNADRCGKVLPAIDQYFQVSGDFLNNGAILEATIPVNC
ncbi:hypothetical protein F5Y16DRAFT_203546 [Xylariaceae sp. FL0255]|nr:hypothetical protein F5Y16DRAFT_203546 [Xylariaceae sp. FL0255]